MTTEFKLSQLIFPPPTTSPIVAPSSPFQRPSISFPCPMECPQPKWVICPAFLTQASKAYEVDIDTYTCTCLDYPLISYCKHICAVQQFFDEDGVFLMPVALAALPNDAILAPVAPRTSSVPKPGPLVVVAGKTRRLAARLRRPTRLHLHLLLISRSRGCYASATDHLAVLPSAQYFAPVVKHPQLDSHAAGIRYVVLGQATKHTAQVPVAEPRKARCKSSKNSEKGEKSEDSNNPLPPVPQHLMLNSNSPAPSTILRTSIRSTILHNINYLTIPLPLPRQRRPAPLLTIHPEHIQQIRQVAQSHEPRVLSDRVQPVAPPPNYDVDDSCALLATRLLFAHVREHPCSAPGLSL
ncbi:hypothetical protein B0H13DRAFT_2340890 [Mycena leptocephala]|nr:hypothetical protein B0H13DRAFT_2340890 [Mycena leptocephala]